MCIDAMRAALLVENANRCTPPLEEQDILAIAKSVGRYPPYFDKTPIDGIQDPLTFPENLMAGVAGDFAKLFGKYIEPPEVFLYFAFLTCLGSMMTGVSASTGRGRVSELSRAVQEILLCRRSASKCALGWGGSPEPTTSSDRGK